MNLGDLTQNLVKKIDIRSVSDDIYSIMRSNQCSGSPPPFSDHVGGRANAMVNRYPWYSGIFFILGVTTEIEGSIKTSRTPFLHLHKVQDQGYILCIYNYAQKCIVIALQNHFRKGDHVSHYVESFMHGLIIAHSTIIKDIMVAEIWSQQNVHQTFVHFMKIGIIS